MDITLFTTQMETQAQIIRQLMLGISPEQARWKPDPESWSILEVINHLLDEERSDFRVRLDYLLNKPGQDWPPINPQGWVVERRYNDRDLAESLADFLDERQKSLAWLHSLPPIDWDASSQAPWGVISAGDLFAAWVAHDLLHTRQLVELRYAWTVRSLAPYTVAYAGDW